MTIALWMLYAVAVGALVGAGALLAERGAGLLRLPRRGVWALAMMASAAAPLAIPALRAVPEAADGGLGGAALGPLSVIPLGSNSSAPAPAGAPWMEWLLWAMWAAATVGVVAWLARCAWALRRARQGWEWGEVAGARLLVSHDTGPAVMGFLRPEIVLPFWVLDWSGDQQRMVVAHEREHIAARDPLLVLLALSLAALFPWNPALWWQLHRLRLAVEVDCDGRVLRGLSTARDYGLLLLEVGRRASPGALPLPAFSEPTSFLERRIRAMTTNRARHAIWTAVMTMAVVVAVPAALYSLPAAEPPALPVGSWMGARQGATGGQDAVTLWIMPPGEYRLDSRDGAVVPESALESTLRTARKEGAKSVTIRVPWWPDAGYSVVVAKYDACRVGFDRGVLEAEAPEAPGSETLKWQRWEWTLAPADCAATSAVADTALVPIAAPAPAAPAGSPAAALKPALAQAAAPSPRAAGSAVAPAAAPKDFTGIGTLERQRSGVEASAPAAARADTTPPLSPGQLSEQPRLKNAAELGTAMKALFPKMLRAAGVSGSAKIQFVIEKDGTVDPRTVKVISTTNPEFSEPSVKAIELARFEPGKYKGEPVRVLVRMPITWKAPAPQPADSKHD